MIKVIVKHPGHPAFSCLVQNTLEAFQKLVGGYIETFTIETDLVIICNEEGKLMGLDENVQICGETFVGTIVVAGVKDDEFDSVDPRIIKILLPKLWEV